MDSWTHLITWLHTNCLQGSRCFELVKGAPAGFVAAVIGLIAAGLTYRQYRVARAKLKLDLFDKRMKVFQQVWTILSKASIVDNKVTLFEQTSLVFLPDEFVEFVHEAKFLFGNDVLRYIRECMRNLSELMELQSKTEHVAGVNTKRRIELVAWFRDQTLKNCAIKFGRYLDLRSWQ